METEKKSEKKKESIIEKIESKAKEIGGEIKGVAKEVIENIEDGVEKIGGEVKDIIEKNKEVLKKKPHSKNNPIKEKAVKALAEKIKNAKTLMIVSIKGLPSRQFQGIKKSIREHANVQVAKRNIMLKAINAVGGSILDLEKDIQENSAFVTSDLEGYELAGILAQKKTPAAAKAGQESPVEIEVKAGPTDLVPGPAISELGSVGLQIAVEDGKLSIKEDKVIVTEGQTIDANTASILQKLNILPFSVGLEPVALYDTETGKIYRDIKINPEEAAENLRSAASKALGFAQKIVYYAKETMGYLLAKANANNQALSKLAPAEEEKKEEPKAEEKKEEEKPTEEKAEEAPAEETKEEEPKTEENDKGSESKDSESVTQTKSEEEK